MCWPRRESLPRWVAPTNPHESVYRPSGRSRHAPGMLAVGTLRMVLVVVVAVSSLGVVFVVRRAPDPVIEVVPVSLSVGGHAESAVQVLRPERWQPDLWRPLRDPPPPAPPPAATLPPLRATLLAIGHQDDQLNALISLPESGLERLAVGDRSGRLEVLAIDPAKGEVEVRVDGRTRRLAVSQ